MLRINEHQAGYMELAGAKKDAECDTVMVQGGVSSEKGCCNLYWPEPKADEFKCGECVHVGKIEAESKAHFPSGRTKQ